MAIFQSIFNFFLPSQRPSGAGAGGGGPDDVASQRLLNRVDEALGSAAVSEDIAEVIKGDVKNAFIVYSPRPGYEPEAVAPVGVSLSGLLTSPIETTKKIASTLSKGTIQDLGLSADSMRVAADKAVWRELFKDPVYGTRIPYSVRKAVLRWNEGVNARVVRVGRDIRNNPGTILMMSSALERIDPTLKVGGVSITSLRRAAVLAEHDISAALAKEDWASASDIQKKFNKKWGEAKEELLEEFETSIRKDPDFASSPEAQFYRYWKRRDLHYATLNLLRTYRKDGAWGVINAYGWQELKKKVFKGRLKYLYPPNAIDTISKKLLGSTLAKRLTSIRSLTRKAVSNVLERIGLSSLIEYISVTLGTALGPGVGNAIGAVFGAVVQFFGEVVTEKLGGALKMAGYAVAGAIGCAVLFAIAAAVLVSIILGNVKFPWETTAGVIDCNVEATATDSCVASKSEVKRIADNWGVGPGNHVEECYNDVIAQSDAYGVDPRIAMATWLHESNASNYTYYESVGEEPEDFGIPAQKGEGFTAQINSFLGFYNGSKSRFSSCYRGRSDAEGFFRAFCTAGRESLGVGQCPNLTAEGEACVTDFMRVYNWINTCR